MIDEPTLAQWLEQARSFVDERKYLHALQVYRKITSNAPSLDIAWVELAYVHYELKQYDAAEKTLLKALSTSKEPQEILFLVGNLYLKLNQHNKAITYYKKLLMHELSLSKDLRAHLNFNIALAYYHRENVRLSEQHFRKTLKIDPHFPKINESLGELLLRRGLFSEAIQYLKEAIKVEPYSWIGHYLLGMAHTKVYDWRKAYDEFVVAIEMDPNEPRAWQMCGEVLVSLQQLDEAEQYLRKALELNPHCTDAVVDVGYLFLKRGDYQHAREFFERALEMEPHHPKALQGTRELTLSSKSHS
ncbi:MAG: tetratricopeptide repeat protein [Ignavibacteriales bacterium]|nr:tetratricopeptide repeat protein [Ignavibacteriales bacterium]